MNDKECQKQVAETGRILLEKKLVARTWGNISARVLGMKFAISPSGLGYEHMTEEDVPVYDDETGAFTGTRKPSSEKLVHAAAYRIYPEVRFVIHTHQDYATAVGLVGTKELELHPEEKEVLGKIEVASYGLPGTKKLGANVEAALKTGAKIILMKHHGALILGSDRDDAIAKAELLETVCKRAVLGKIGEPDRESSEVIDAAIVRAAPNMKVHATPDLLYMAEAGGFKAQLDDMAQMLGSRIRAVKNDPDLILGALQKQDAVLVRNVGCVTLTEKADDGDALMLLMEKAATAKRYSEAFGVQADLSAFDCALMRTVYKMKYSKKKEG